eukprot:21571-Amphidinium_carterae.1
MQARTADHIANMYKVNLCQTPLEGNDNVEVSSLVLFVASLTLLGGGGGLQHFELDYHTNLLTNV